MLMFRDVDASLLELVASSTGHKNSSSTRQLSDSTAEYEAGPTAVAEGSGGFQAEQLAAAGGVYGDGLGGSALAGELTESTAVAAAAVAEVPKKLRLELGWELFKPSEEEEEEAQIEFALTIYDVKVSR